MKDNYQLIELQPFGICIYSKDSSISIDVFSEDQIEIWIKTYKIVVFRGFKIFTKQEFALHAQKLGEPLQWPFGAVNELIVKKDSENYIYTNHKVPMHWDGAFVKKIPYLILFQCITAPDKQSGGGTTFCNTALLLEGESEEFKKKWNKISVTYKTEKLAHYGGEIQQKVIDKHPVHNIDIIRFAEPVHDINPVHLKVKGLENGSEEDFVREMQSKIYDEKYLYTHFWEDGDLVMADNHALLHGREAFVETQSRYIQRINLIERPRGFSSKRFIKNSFTIRRKEFFIAELPIIFIPILLSFSSFSDLTKIPFILGVLSMILLFNIGDMINCYADYKQDSIYKSHLSNAVYELGKSNIKLQIILSGIVALVFTSISAYLSKEFVLIPLAIIGMFLGLQYSMPPIKFKSRGILQFICLWIIIFVGPMIYITILTQGTLLYSNLLFFGLYGLHQMGIILFNTAEDYIEDSNEGLKTIVIQLGLYNTLRLAWWIIFVAGFCIQLALFNNFSTSSFIIKVMSIGIYTLGWSVIIFETKGILKKIKGLNEIETTDILKKNGMKVPRWLKIGAYSILTAIVLMKFNMGL